MMYAAQPEESTPMTEAEYLAKEIMMTVMDIVEQAKALSPQERRELIDRLLALPEEALWSEDELAEMLSVEPLTGKEIVEAGLTGGWRDLNIADGAEWVEQQRHKRRERRRW